jgi:polysaccharide pyruvyl transferase WcaK-like protein
MKSPAPRRFFVTGLCMQGNKGGAALALSLVEAIRTEIPEASFVFSVPGETREWVHEQTWAKRYGFDVCQNASLSCLLPPLCFRGDRLRRMLAWWKMLRGCDVLLQMSAICYIGPPAGAGTFRAMIRSRRVFDFFMSRLARRPMLAWTQSYGPFTTSAVRFFARMDLNRQPVIFCRGDDCATAVRHLVPEVPAASFPDVATTLPFDHAWGAAYVTRTFTGIGPFVTLSPSAVMYSRGRDQTCPNRHVTNCQEICAHVTALGLAVILLPHTLRPDVEDPDVCDLAVARIVKQAAPHDRVVLLEANLSPLELKAIIANAAFHIGARYHSVVAALSAAVPALSLSWHPKYLDLMRSYGMQDFVVHEDDKQVVGLLLNRIHAERSALKTQLALRQRDVAAMVHQNASQFCSALGRMSRAERSPVPILV